MSRVHTVMQGGIICMLARYLKSLLVLLKAKKICSKVFHLLLFRQSPWDSSVPRPVLLPTTHPLGICLYNPHINWVTGAVLGLSPLLPSEVPLVSFSSYSLLQLQFFTWPLRGLPLQWSLSAEAALQILKNRFTSSPSTQVLTKSSIPMNGK